MTTALVESPENDQVLPSLSLGTMVVGQDTAPEMDSVALEMTLPVHRDVLPKHQPGRLIGLWVPDPRGESGLICIWVPRTGTEASVSFNA